MAMGLVRVIPFLIPCLSKQQEMLVSLGCSCTIAPQKGYGASRKDTPDVLIQRPMSLPGNRYFFGVPLEWSSLTCWGWKPATGVVPYLKYEFGPGSAVSVNGADAHLAVLAEGIL